MALSEENNIYLSAPLKSSLSIFFVQSVQKTKCKNNKLWMYQGLHARLLICREQ